MQLTKESQDKINKAAAAMAATEAAILLSSANELAPIISETTYKTFTKATQKAMTKKARDKITKDYLRKYKANMVLRKGSYVGETVVEDIGKGQVKIYTRTVFKPWLKDLSIRERYQVSKIISEGAKNSENPKVIAKRLESHFAGTKSNALTAAKSESAKVRYNINVETRKASGQKYLQYISALLETTRPWHARRHLKVYKIGEEPALDEPNCYCTYVSGDYAKEFEGIEPEESSAIIMDKAEYEKATGKKI